MASGCDDWVRDTSLRATLAMYSKGLSWRLRRMPSPRCPLAGLGGAPPLSGLGARACAFSLLSVRVGSSRGRFKVAQSLLERGIGPVLGYV